MMYLSTPFSSELMTQSVGKGYLVVLKKGKQLSKPL